MSKVNIDVRNRALSTAGLMGLDMGTSNYPLQHEDTITIQDSSVSGSIVISQESEPTLYASYMQRAVGGLIGGGVDVISESTEASQATLLKNRLATLILHIICQVSISSRFLPVDSLGSFKCHHRKFLF
jgi:hypothetical protein